MAPSNKAASHFFGRHVAPFAPVVLALLLGRSALPGGAEPAETGGDTVAAVKCDEVLDFQDCHTRYRTGCTAAGRYDAYVNLLKNQLIDPSSTQATKPVGFLTLKNYTSLDGAVPDGLKKSNHFDFKDQLAKMGEGQVFTTVAFLYYAMPSGVESSNCQLPKDDDEGTNVDYHIGIGFDPDTAKDLRGSSPGIPGKKKKVPKKLLQQTSIIVEMTPHFRLHFEDEIWSIANLKKAIGRQIRVTGQLVLDSEHYVPAQDCALATSADERTSCWRASAWELHPVVRFQVCSKASNDCTPDDSTDWIEMDRL